jgi:hypothetical protein
MRFSAAPSVSPAVVSCSHSIKRRKAPLVPLLSGNDFDWSKISHLSVENIQGLVSYLFFFAVVR